MAALAVRRLREPVEMAATRDGFFPRVFLWRGRRHDVRAVESCRTEQRRGLARRHVFRVRTDRAVFELAQDLAHDAWRVEQMWGGD
jgi:hypothetical protein